MTREEYWKEKREAEHYMKAEEQEMRKEFESDAADLFLTLFGVLIAQRVTLVKSSKLTVQNGNSLTVSFELCTA